MAAASLADYIRNVPQYLLPQKGLSRLTYTLTRARTRWFKNTLISVFIRHFDVDLSEAAQPDRYAYPSFNAFFTRALRDDARPLADDPRALCSPVDGAVSQAGVARDEVLIQAKGRDYSLVDLLGGDEARARPFRDGAYATLYLSPRDYHRIHLPLAGQLVETVHVPGRLFSVSPLTARVVPRLFARNERLVTIFATDLGPMALVMVGAVNVGSMETVWAGQITPPYGNSVTTIRYDRPDDRPPRFGRGEEIGRFNMGSTVILLFAADAVRWSSTLTPASAVRMGQAIGEPAGRRSPINENEVKRYVKR